jgi:hypothetical protein
MNQKLGMSSRIGSCSGVRKMTMGKINKRMSHSAWEMRANHCWKVFIVLYTRDFNVCIGHHE